MVAFQYDNVAVGVALLLARDSAPQCLRVSTLLAVRRHHFRIETSVRVARGSGFHFAFPGSRDIRCLPGDLRDRAAIKDAAQPG